MKRHTKFSPLIFLAVVLLSSCNNFTRVDADNILKVQFKEKNDQYKWQWVTIKVPLNNDNGTPEQWGLLDCEKLANNGLLIREGVKDRQLNNFGQLFIQKLQCYSIPPNYVRYVTDYRPNDIGQSQVVVSIRTLKYNGIVNMDISQEKAGMITAYYTLLAEPNEYGKFYGANSEVLNASAVFKKYDDGWKLIAN